MHQLSLILEIHHPLPGPGEPVGAAWARAAVETYWPLLRVIGERAERGAETSLTVAVSPSWTALAADPAAQALTRSMFDRLGSRSEASHGLGRYVYGRWEGDPLQPLREAGVAGAIELIPTTAGATWLPSVAGEPVVARAQVALAAADHERRFGLRPEGLWLPFLAYVPGLESCLAEAGLRYFAVGEHAFLRGTLLPPLGVLGPLISSAGVAAFGVSPGPTRHLTDPEMRYARDPRYDRPDEAEQAAADHARHFLGALEQLAHSAPPGVSGAPIALAALNAHDLGHSWGCGARWLEAVLRLLEGKEWGRPVTPGRYMDRNPEGPLGRPGPCAGGPLSVRPHGSDLLDRCRVAAEVLASCVARRRSLGPLARRAVAQMTRSLLQAQNLDWHLPPGSALSPEEGLARAGRHLARFHELAHLLQAGRLDAPLLARHELGPAYLPDIDLELLAD